VNESINLTTMFYFGNNYYYVSLFSAASVPPMSFTKGPFPAYAITDHALQIFSVQVTEVKDDVEWPLHVYGWVATRDSVDPKRNLLFNRTRDNCQVLTQQGYVSMYVFLPLFFSHFSCS
jgi:hypothetical protein